MYECSAVKPYGWHLCKLNILAILASSELLTYTIGYTICASSKDQDTQRTIRTPAISNAKQLKSSRLLAQTTVHGPVVWKSSASPVDVDKGSFIHINGFVLSNNVQGLGTLLMMQIHQPSSNPVTPGHSTKREGLCACRLDHGV